MKFALVHLGKNMGGVVLDAFTPTNDGFFLNEQPACVTKEGAIFFNFKHQLDTSNVQSFALAAQRLDARLQATCGQGIDSIILLKCFSENDDEIALAMQEGIGRKLTILTVTTSPHHEVLAESEKFPYSIGDKGVKDRVAAHMRLDDSDVLQGPTGYDPKLDDLDSVMRSLAREACGVIERRPLVFPRPR